MNALLTHHAIERRDKTWLNECFSESIDSLIVLNISRIKKIQKLQIKKQNTRHVYNFVFKKIQEIYVLRNSDRKEFKKFGPETIETQALIYRSEKLKILQDLGSRSKVQGRLGLVPRGLWRAGMDYVEDFRCFFREGQARSLHGVTSRLDRCERMQNDDQPGE